MKKKVAILCPCLSKGGAEKTVSILSQYLDKYYELYLFLFDASMVTYSYKGRIIDLKFSFIDNEIKNIKFMPRIIKLIIKTIKQLIYIRMKKKEYNISCSISFLETPNIFNILTKRKNEKIIVSVRSTRSLQNHTKYEKIENMGIFLYKFSNKVISISDGVKYDLIRNFKINQSLIKTIYNPLLFTEIIKLNKEMIEEKYRFIFNQNDVILSIGRLITDKGHARLINEMPFILKKYPKAIAVIMGDGEEENKLKLLANKLGVKNKVIFIPFNKNPYKYMANSKVLAFPSEREGYGNVILESMACNLPVVATDCLSGPREIIAGNSNYSNRIKNVEKFERGILIPIKELEEEKNSLGKALLEMLTNQNYREKVIANSYEYIKSYNIENIIRSWKETIEDNER